MSRNERSHWRDEAFSLRHRQHWGLACPAVDIDFLMIEYDFGRPTALVEYKHECALPEDFSHTSYIAITRLADMARIPAFSVRYSRDMTEYTVTPLNSWAENHAHKGELMTELDYVSMLYLINGREMSDQLRDSLELGLPAPAGR